MKFLSVLFTFLLFVVAIYGRPTNHGSGTSVSQPKAEEPQIRRTRDVNDLLPIQVSGSRIKRQHRGRGPPHYDSSQSAANAAANSNFFGRDGFGASAADAQAQGFRSQGPLGSFGASAANTQTQGFTAGPGGIQGSAGASGSQVYNLPNGKTINVAFSNGFAAGPTGISGSNAHGVTIT